MPLVEALEERAREHPEAPWLFYRRGLDWHWRSYARVADQAARSARNLACGRGEDSTPAAGAALACLLSQDPDALAALVAALSSGRAFDCGAEVPPAPGRPGDAPSWLASCRGPLESFSRQPLPAPAGPPPGEQTRHSLLRLSRDVAFLSASLSPALRAVAQRPILYAGAGDADPAKLASLAGWSLQSHAAWALEPYPEAFAATALWTRPHVLIATAAELEGLAAHFDRSARRHSRLKAILLSGALPPEAEREALAARFACAVLAWPEA